VNRTEDYRNAGLPMFPVTHGRKFTALHVLLYTLALFACSLLPFAYGKSGWIYLVTAIILGAGFIAHSWRLYARYTDSLARGNFRYLIIYLAVLFGSLLVDRYALV
jgi:protoheme IX farnesyltransferase